MLRLTELSRTPPECDLRLEGFIDAAGLRALAEKLETYRAAGLRRAVVDIDGLYTIDNLALLDLRSALPEGLKVRFLTSRTALHALMENCGLPTLPLTSRSPESI